PAPVSCSYSSRRRCRPSLVIGIALRSMRSAPDEGAVPRTYPRAHRYNSTRRGLAAARRRGSLRRAALLYMVVHAAWSRRAACNSSACGGKEHVLTGGDRVTDGPP